MVSRYEIYCNSMPIATTRSYAINRTRAINVDNITRNFSQIFFIRYLSNFYYANDTVRSADVIAASVVR